MDQGGHRGRAFHRVRQPSVQDQLRRFAHRADEQQEGNQIRRIPIAPKKVQLHRGQLWTDQKDILKLDAIGYEIQAKDTQQKSEIANPVNHKGFDCRRPCALFADVEPNQQIRGHAHPFPAKEQLQQVVRGHQHQHGKCEKR